VHLYEQDSFQPFPGVFLGQFDIVNLRSALCYVNNEDAEPLLNNLISLLSKCVLLRVYCDGLTDFGENREGICSSLSLMR
jgi:hypothetical protein